MKQTLRYVFVRKKICDILWSMYKTYLAFKAKLSKSCLLICVNNELKL